MPDHTLSSNISSTKIFPKFLLPIEEFTLHQRRKLEGALQLHFTHWDHAEGVFLLQCSEVFFSLPYCIPNHSFLFRRKNQSCLMLFFSSILQSHPSRAVAFSKCGSCCTRWDRKDFSDHAAPSTVGSGNTITKNQGLRTEVKEISSVLELLLAAVNKCDSRARQSSFLDRVCLKEEWIFSVLKSKRPSVTSWCCFQRFFACAVLSVAVFIHCSLCELKCWGSSWHASSSASFWSEYLVAIGTKSKGHTPFK